MSETFSMLIDIRARVDQAIRNIKGLENTVEKTSSKFDTMRTAMGQAAGMLINQFSRAAAASIKETISLGADVQTLRNSFEAMASAAGRADLTLEQLREATQGTVSDVDLLTSANKFMALNLPVDEMEQLMGSAIQLGRAMGLGAAQSVNDLSVALGRNSPLVLDNFGVSLKLAQAQELLAERLGKSVDGLTDVEKASAFQIIAIEKITEKANTLAGTTSEATLSQDRFAASITNLKSRVGELLAPLSSMAPAFSAMLPAIGQMSVTALPKLGSAISGAGGVVPALGSLVTAMTGPIGMAVLVVAAVGTIIAALRKWRNENDAVIAAQRGVERAMESVSTASQAATSAAEAYAAAEGLVDAAGQQVTTTMEARREAADALTEAETALIAAQATLTDSENNLATAQSNLAATMGFVTGEVDALNVSTDDMVFSSIQAEQAYGELSSQLLDLQGSYSLTGMELERFNGLMDDNSDSMRGNRLEIAKIQDAIQDRRDATVDSIRTLQEEKEALEALIKTNAEMNRITSDTVTKRIVTITEEIASLEATGRASEDEARALRELRSANRDLSISNQELAETADIIKDSFEDQAKLIDSATESVNLLTAADERVIEALDEVKTNSDAVATAQGTLTEKTKALKEASDALAESLSDKIAKQLESGEAHLAASRAAAAEERALWSLLAAQDSVEFEREKKAADLALRQQGITPTFQTLDEVIPGMAAGGIVSRPTLAVVGEAGPEAVIPLSQLQSIIGAQGAGAAPGGGGVQIAELRVVIENANLDPENMDTFFEDFMLRFNDRLRIEGGVDLLG